MYRLSNVFDYYMLLTLQFEAENAVDGFPTRSQEKFLDTVSEKVTDMEAGLATTIFNYLVLACAGEARHATGMSRGKIDDIEPSLSRESACKRITKYDPIDSLRKMADLFSNYNWSSAYGGERWGNIADFALQFGEGKITRQFFIDHIVDLVHNGGFAFSKPESLNYAGLVSDVSQDRLVEFLNLKTFSTSLLRVELEEKFVRRMSLSTKSLVSRFYVIFRNGEELPAVWEIAQNESPSLEVITWGDKVLSDVEENDQPRDECCECGGHACSSCGYYDDDGHLYCSDCWNDICHQNDTQCDRCGDWCSDDDVVNVEGDSWCPSCAEYHAATCEKCGELVKDHHTVTVDGDTWCDYCAQSHAHQCESCGEWTAAEMVEVTHQGHWGEITDYLCLSCAEEKAATCAMCGDIHYKHDMIYDQLTGQYVCDHGICYDYYVDDPNALYKMLPAQPTEGQLALPYAEVVELPF